MRLTIIALAILALPGCGTWRWSDPDTETIDVEQPRARPASVDEWRKEVDRLTRELTAAEHGLQAAREDVIRTRLWWFVGVMAALAAGSVALAIFVPSAVGLAIKAGLSAIACAGLAAGAAWLLPYLVWIGGALVLAAIVGAIVYWRLDAKSRDQVVRAVDGIKDRVPDYRAHFRQFVDDDADRHLDGVRVRLGLKPR